MKFPNCSHASFMWDLQVFLCETIKNRKWSGFFLKGVNLWSINVTHCSLSLKHLELLANWHCIYIFNALFLLPYTARIEIFTGNLQRIMKWKILLLYFHKNYMWNSCKKLYWPPHKTLYVTIPVYGVGVHSPGPLWWPPLPTVFLQVTDGRGREISLSLPTTSHEKEEVVHETFSVFCRYFQIHTAIKKYHCFSLLETRQVYCKIHMCVKSLDESSSIIVKLPYIHTVSVWYEFNTSNQNLLDVYEYGLNTKPTLSCQPCCLVCLGAGTVFILRTFLTTGGGGSLSVLLWDQGWQSHPLGPSSREVNC